MGILKPQSNGPLYNNTVTGTLAADGLMGVHLVQGGGAWSAGGLRPRPVPSSLYQM